MTRSEHLTWQERICAALKPGRWYARHYTRGDLAALLKTPKTGGFNNAVARAIKDGLIIAEPWGPVKEALRRPRDEVCEPTRLFLATTPLDWRNARDWPTVTDAERDLGLKQSGLYRWLQGHDLLIVCPKHGKTRHVPPQVLTFYQTMTDRPGIERSELRPAGYVGVYKAADILGASTHLVQKAAERGQVRAVRVGYINYYCQDDLEHFARELKNTPLPGWELILSRTKPRAADNTAAADWLRRNAHEVRKYRTPDKQLGLYALSSALDLWEQHHESYDKRVLTQAQTNSVRHAINRGDTNYRIAKTHGVQAATVRGIRRGTIYRPRITTFAELHTAQQQRLSETARSLQLPPRPPEPLRAPALPLAPASPAPAPPEPPEPLSARLEAAAWGGYIGVTELFELTGIAPDALSLAAHYAGARRVNPAQGRTPRRVIVRFDWAQSFLAEVLPQETLWTR